jgi:predicted alpha/beta-fold hydrolase
LKNIRVPTFALHAADDWVCMERFMPLEQFSAPASNILVATTTTGTHACHLTGTVYPTQFYPKQLVSFLTFLEKSI